MILYMIIELSHLLPEVTYQVTYQVRPHLIRRRIFGSCEACRARLTKLVHEEAHLLVSHSF